MRGGNSGRISATKTLNRKRRDRYSEQAQRDQFGKKKIQQIHPDELPKEDLDEQEL